jgi:hypothetical protein
MTVEQIEKRFEELQDQIDAYRKRIEVLEQELKIVARFGNFVTYMRRYGEGKGAPTTWAKVPTPEIKRLSANGVVSLRKNILSLKSAEGNEPRRSNPA